MLSNGLPSLLSLLFTKCLLISSCVKTATVLLISMPSTIYISLIKESIVLTETRCIRKSYIDIHSDNFSSIWIHSNVRVFCDLRSHEVIQLIDKQ